MKKEPSFKDYEIRKGNLKVVWEWIGEGWNGDYNDTNSEDEPLLRFSCYKKTGKGNSWDDWTQMDDASYCTRMPITSKKKWLKQGALEIIDAIEHESYKRRLEELSWFEPEDFEKKKV